MNYHVYNIYVLQYFIFEHKHLFWDLPMLLCAYVENTRWVK